MRLASRARRRLEQAIATFRAGDRVAVDARAIDLTSDAALATLWALLEGAIDPGVGSIELHLDGGGEVDTRVLAVMVAAAARARASRADLTIVVSARLREVARVCRLDGILVLREADPERRGKLGNPAVTPAARGGRTLTEGRRLLSGRGGRARPDRARSS